MMKIKFILTVSLLTSLCFGQIDEFSYKRKVSTINDEWHRVELPNSIFSKIASNFSDIRCFGITATNDTVEAAYFINLKEEEITTNEIQYELLNVVKNENGYYYTFKIPTSQAINEIELDFGLNDYDWKVKLEASQNQFNWFTVVEDYRILSISTQKMDYNFSRVTFPKTEFRYFRLFIPSAVEPELIMPKVRMNSIVNGKTRNFKVVSQKITQDKKKKQTIIEINLEQAVPINSIRINCTNKFDYYRNVSIDYLYDSTKTEKGYLKNFVGLNHGILSSIEHKDFQVSNVIAKNIRISISNNDNQPLDISEVEVKGIVHELVVRFTEKADYFLVYGNAKANQPNYEINHLKSTIPKELKTLELSNEERISPMDNSNSDINKEETLLSKNWIWFLMVIIIFILGWFTLKMMRSEGQNGESQPKE